MCGNSYARCGYKHQANSQSAYGAYIGLKSFERNIICGIVEQGRQKNKENNIGVELNVQGQPGNKARNNACRYEQDRVRQLYLFGHSRKANHYSQNKEHNAVIFHNENGNELKCFAACADAPFA